MRGLVEVAAYATVAGLAIPAGGLVARLERIQPKWLEQELRHGVLVLGPIQLVRFSVPGRVCT